VEPLNQSPGAIADAAEGNPTVPSFGTGEPSKWSPRFWANAPQAGLRFATEEELDAAIDWLWSVPALRDLPRVHVGRNTMIVPEAAVDIFRQKGYHFTLCTVVSAGDLSAEEVNRIRREG